MLSALASFLARLVGLAAAIARASGVLAVYISGAVYRSRLCTAGCLLDTRRATTEYRHGILSRNTVTVHRHLALPPARHRLCLPGPPDPAGEPPPPVLVQQGRGGAGRGAGRQPRVG